MSIKPPATQGGRSSTPCAAGANFGAGRPFRPRRLVGLLLAAGLAWASGTNAWAQGFADSQPFSGRQVDSIAIRLTNPSGDAAFNARIEDSVRRALGLFPGTAYSEDRLSLALGTARRNAAIAGLDFDTLPSTTGGVDVVVEVTLRDDAQPADGKGFLITGNLDEFPLAYDRNGTVLRFKLDALALYYGNNNAWFGRPDLMLAVTLPPRPSPI